jgi:NADH-quinone oxidoreductase subunit C
VGLSPEAVCARAVAVVPAATPVAAGHTRGQAAVSVPREGIVTTLRALRDDPELRLDVLVDVTAVDFLGRSPRFEVVYMLRSHPHGHRLRVKAGVPAEDPSIDSTAALWPAANWVEREVWDLFGIRFVGHPDLRRILMYESFEGHPLRKDYPLQHRQPLVPERDPIARPWYPRRAGA